MIKRILMTGAFCGLMASTALAQVQTTPQAATPMQGSGSAMGGGDFIAVQDQKHWLAEDLIGTSVKNADQDIGEIENLLFDDSGQVAGVIISVGEFLGVGGKNVAVPFDKLNISPDPNDASDYLVNVTYTKEQLEQAPPFQTLEEGRKATSRTAPAAAPAGGMGSGGAVGGSPGTTTR